MVAEGAAIVDVGGESTRPGSGGVTVDEELRRVVPVLERLQGVPVSIDTAKSEVARRALELGAELVNDVTALRGDPELAGVVADAGGYLCLMHMQGEPRTMQVDPRYDDVAGEVAAFLERQLSVAVAAGIPEEHVCLDPGIGFGKTAEHNFELLRRLDVLLALGRPVLVGLSRKSSLGRLFDPAATTGTLAASLGAAVAAYERGASIFASTTSASTSRRSPRQEPYADRDRGDHAPGRHGVLEHERRDGQLFVFDVALEVDEPAEDDIDATVDYRDVVACVREVSDGRAFQLLETLAGAVADELMRRFRRRAHAFASASPSSSSTAAGRPSPPSDDPGLRRRRCQPR